MKVTKHVLWVVPVIGAVMVWWFGHDDIERTSPEPANTPAQVAASDLDNRQAEVAPNASPTQGGAALPTSGHGSSWATLVRESEDYWAFAEKAHAAAIRGDAAAQWYLAIALNDCEFTYANYFLEPQPEGGVRHRSIDEARIFAMTKMGRPSASFDDELIHLQKKCTRLSQAPDHPFGSGEEWTQAAAAGGFPQAQAAVAHARALQARNSVEGEDSSAAMVEVRALAMESLRTKDPDVFPQIASIVATLEGNGVEGNKRSLSWLLAACLRSPGCESLKETMNLRCRFDIQCQPYETPLDVIRRDAGNDFDEVERRARELNEKIDAGTLEESDI